MAASLKVKRTPITAPPYQVPSVDITPDPPIFSLVTTFKDKGETFFFIPFFGAINFTKLNYFIFEMWKNKMLGQFSKNYKELFIKKLSLSSQKYLKF
jgi:hypothetical protein